MLSYAHWLPHSFSVHMCVYKPRVHLAQNPMHVEIFSPNLADVGILIEITGFKIRRWVFSP